MIRVFYEAECSFSSRPTPEIIAQKLYYLKYCLANSLSVFLANLYILNYPISNILYFTVRLVAYQQGSGLSVPSRGYVTSL